ncbi:MAG: hypothetical protein VCC01_13935, partial [Candidatus Hydrogenedentota bacterium]
VKKSVADVHSPGVLPSSATTMAEAAEPDNIDHFKKLIRQAQNRMGFEEASLSTPPPDLYSPAMPSMPIGRDEGQTPVTTEATPGYPRRENVVPAEPIPFGRIIQRAILRRLLTSR